MTETQIRSAVTRSVPSEYEQLIAQMKFFIESEISCSRFFGMACFTEQSIAQYRQTLDPTKLVLSELGEFIAARLNDGIFIDVPCGRFDTREKTIDFDLIPLVSALGAAKYWEVDIDSAVMKDRISPLVDVIDNNEYQLMNGIDVINTRTENDLNITSMQDDVLGFVSKVSTEQSKTFYISALQPDASFIADDNRCKEIALPYIHALYNELSRACVKGDLLILNSSSMLVSGLDDAHPAIHPTLALPPLGFTLMRRCAYDKVHVFLKD